jgi:hypothetical protein
MAAVRHFVLVWIYILDLVIIQLLFILYVGLIIILALGAYVSGVVDALNFNYINLMLDC